MIIAESVTVIYEKGRDISNVNCCCSMDEDIIFSLKLVD